MLAVLTAAAALLGGVLAQSCAQHARQLAQHLWVGNGFATLIILNDLGLFIDELRQQQGSSACPSSTTDSNRSTHAANPTKASLACVLAGLSLQLH